METIIIIIFLEDIKVNENKISSDEIKNLKIRFLRLKQMNKLEYINLAHLQNLTMINMVIIMGYEKDLKIMLKTITYLLVENIDKLDISNNY